MPARAPLQIHLVRLMRWAAFFALGLAIIALVLLVRGDPEVRVYRFIATALGVGLGALLGIGLMTILLLANRQGRRESAANSIKKEDNDPRS